LLLSKNPKLKGYIKNCIYQGSFGYEKRVAQTEVGRSQSN